MGNKYDFFLSRRGAVANIAREVADVLSAKGYRIIVQDYDIPFTANFVEAMHEAVKNSRDLMVLFTSEYEASPHTRKEFTSFEADRAQSIEERRVIILRCEDVALRGLFAAHVYQDLVGIDDPDERKRRIIAAAEGQSQAQKPPSKIFVGAPPRIASFTGRDAEFDRLDAILIGGRPAAVTQATGNANAQIGRAAVQGLGGVGKTSLAVEYAYRFRDLYAGVWWCPAETRTGLMTSLAGLAVELGAARTDDADIERAARAALRRLAEQRATFLLVYDNVTSPEEIADLLPTSGARVLITSRFPDWSEWADEVALDALPLAEATAFLQGRAGRVDECGARTLAEALGCLPLALDHGAAYCRRTQMSFDEYAAKSVTLMATAVRGAAYSRTVAATFDLAIVEAVAQAPAAEHLIAYLAHCAPERIPMMLVESALEDGADRSGALVALADISLVRNGPFEDGTPAISVHRLVQAAARGRIEKSALATLANQRLKTQLTRLFPTDGFSNPSSWTHCARLAPHCHQALNQTGMSPPKNADDAHLWNMMGRYFHGRADYKQAERCFRSALEIREELLGNTHQDTAKSLSDLAALLMERNQLIEARSLLERAVTIAEATVGRDHEFTAAILNNFARLLQTLNEFDRAEALLKRVIKIFEDIFGENDRHTATSVNNLALLYQARGEFNLAKTTHQRALAIREVVFGSDHPDTANSLNNIATLLRDTGDRIQSEQLYLKAIAIDEKILGLEHPVVGRIKANYARLLLNFERTNEARAIGESALAIHEKGNSVGHNWTKDSAQVTADALDALGLADEAIALRARLGLASSVD